MTTHAVGLDLDPVHPTAWPGETGDSQQGLSLADFPPAYVASPLPGAQLVLDHRWPGSPVGSGLEDDPTPASKRIPLAYAFELLLAAPESRLDYRSSHGDERGPNTADALGLAAAHLLAPTEEHSQRSIALAVPNAIQESAQDGLLRGMRRGLHGRGRTGDSVALVWRPIAAALRWLERFGHSLPNRDGADRESIGRVLHLHLGFEAWESTLLEVVRYQHNGEPWLLPGRRRPATDDLLLQAPLGHLEAIARTSLPALVQKAEATQARMAWHAYWMSPLLREIGTAPGSRLSTQHLPWLPPEAAQQLRQEFLRRIRTAPATQPRWSSRLPRPTPESANASRWLAAIDGIPRTSLLGIVVTGPLAGTPTSNGATLGADFAARIGLSEDRVLVDSLPGRSTVAEGAFVFAHRRLNGQPTYLDTLPEVATIVNIRGEPKWRNLLAHEHEWVIGGETWRGEPKEIRFQIDRGQRELELAVHREGARTCRRVAIQFDAPTSAACPVSLRIEMEPGQGNPRIEVLPADRRIFRGRRFQLDWSLATDTLRGPDQELEAVPRAYPPLEPREANAWVWNERNFNALLMRGGLRAVVLDYLKNPGRWLRDTGSPRDLELLKRWFWFRSKPRRGETGAAVSSDGRPASRNGDQDLLDRFVLALVARIRGAEQDTQRDLLRILGSTSTEREEALQLLRQHLRHVRGVLTAQDRWAVLYACGNCFRSASDLALLFAHWEMERSPDYVDADSLATPLLYRESALDGVDSSRIERWLEKLRLMLGTRRIGLRVPLLVSRSALAIAYLLRRRAFDSLFLVPGSDLHKRLRDAVLSVLRPRTAADTPAVERALDDLQRIVDYLDRRGTGRLTGILSDDDATEAADAQ